MRDLWSMVCVAVAAVIAIGAGCDSNPTPHPQGDVGGADARMDTMAPGVADPDEDGDGVGDCTEAGGFWDGETCRSDVAGESDALGPDGAELGADGDASDGADGDGGEDGEDTGDAAESDSGPDEAD